MSKKLFLRIGINTLLGITFLTIWLHFVNLSEIAAEISQVDFIFLLPFFGLFFLSAFLRSVRLKLLIKDVESDASKPQIGLKNVLYLTFLGQLLSFTIPIRAGEIAKAVYLNTHYFLSLKRAVGIIFFDRFLDFWLVLILSLGLLSVVQTQITENIIRPLTFATIFFSVGFLFLVLFPKITSRIVELLMPIFIFRPVKKIITHIYEFVEEIAGLFRISFLKSFILMMITILALISDALTWYTLFQAFTSNITFIKIFLGSLLSSLTYMIPAAPGYVGSAEASGVAVFSLGLGYDTTLASAVTLVTHALNLICILGFGIFSLYSLKFDLKLVFSKLRNSGK